MTIERVYELLNRVMFIADDAHVCRDDIWPTVAPLIREARAIAEGLVIELDDAAMQWPPGEWLGPRLLTEMQ